MFLKKLKILFHQVNIKLQNKENYKSYFVFFFKADISYYI